MGCWPQRRVAAVLVHTAAAAHIAAAVLYIIRYREMKARFTTPKSGSCDRKGEGCGRKPVGLLRRRVGMEAQRGCLTPGMSAVFTPPHGVSAWLMRHTTGKMAVVLSLIVIVFQRFAICFRCAPARISSVRPAVLWSFAVCFLDCSSMDCCVQIYGFVTLCPNKFG